MNKLITLLLLLLPVFVFAQKGKIVGNVSDARTGEPLIGANVIIEGTLMGTATDNDGNYLILNVDPGTFKLRAVYVGYQDVITENVRVSVNITTDLNFQMEEETYATDVIIVMAERPLVDKNVTNSNNIIKSEDIENLPIRGVNAIVSKEAGIVNQGGNLHVRGSRGDGTAYYVDGVLVNNPVFGNAQITPINNAIEEIQFQAGGYSAEFGGANGGIISTVTKVGAESYDFSVELITDNFIDPGEKYLGGYSYGQSEYVVTAGGPLFPGNKNVRFFVAANNQFERSPQQFYEGIDLKGVFDPSTGAVDTVDLFYPDGMRVNDNQNTYTLQGNLSWDIEPFTIRLNNSFDWTKGRNGVGLAAYNRADRAQMNEGNTFNSSLKLTHVLSNTAFYDVIFNYFTDYFVDMDPIFKHNITAYGDSIENAAIGTELLGDGRTLPTINLYGQTLTRAVQPNDFYRKQRTQQLGANINLLYQVNRHNEVKVGGEVKLYTIRRYAISPIRIAALQKSVANGNIYDIYNRLDNYGYDVFGNQTDAGLEGPRKPIFGAFYIKDKLEFADLIIDAGLRFDYFDIDSKEFIDPGNVLFTGEDELDPAGLRDVDPFQQLSPRLGFSFPVTEKTIFHAQYGKFFQQTRLRDVYQGYNVLADNIKGGFAISQPVGFGLKPERTTSYELGFKQQFGENFAFDVTLFYKDIKDQTQIRSVFADPGASHRQYYAWQNGDFSTVKGLEFKLDLRRTDRVAATFDYTFSTAQGTGSNPSTAFRVIWQSPTATPFFPQSISPLDFNQPHRGTINIDYRFGQNDGPNVFGSKILEQLGANFLLSFNSGHNYTRWDGYGNDRRPLETLNSSATPWFFQLDARVDKTLQVGPVDANVYLWITNLLNRKNVINVFNNSGDATDDGWLSDDEGKAAAESYRQYGDEFVDLYRNMYRAYTYASGNFGPPRQIQLGLRLDF